MPFLRTCNPGRRRTGVRKNHTGDIYYRDAKEFYQIIEDFKDEVPGQTIESLKVQLYLKQQQKHRTHLKVGLLKKMEQQ